MLFPNDDSGKGIMIYNEKTDEVRNIMEESIILDSIVKQISIKRIYAEKDIARDVVVKIKELENL